ncbi:MAG: class I SAM-dependent methyltransferase [Pseudomonadota bacterium]
MSAWTSGYVADIGYTYGYYTELNPLRAKILFSSKGLSFPEIGTACELGFGQGVSVNLHAAASTTRWYGTDFNPSQAGFAQELAAASCVDAKLYDEAFADFCQRADMPDFDYIGLHGIWSWISDENRSIIVEFIRRKLKVGGVLYVSYNTQPGWAAMVPMRDLLTEHAHVMGTSGQGIVSRIDAAINFVDKLMDTNPAYARANPQIKDRVKAIQQQNRHYVAHEYFNRDWQPMSFADMSTWLATAKLDYACSAHFLDHVDAVNLTAPQQSLLAEIPDPMFRETVRDFMVNQQFRRDYWVKGSRKVSQLLQAEKLRLQEVVLITPRVDVTLKATGALGEATMSEGVYNPVLDYLGDHSIRSLGEIEDALRTAGINMPQVLQSVMVLINKGDVSTVQDVDVRAQAKASTARMNMYLMVLARGNNEVPCLASPVTGGGIAVSRFEKLFLLALHEGKKQPEEWAGYASQILRRLGEKILKDGKALESDQENLAELVEQANVFASKRLPILKALDVI